MKALGFIFATWCLLMLVVALLGGCVSAVKDPPQPLLRTVTVKVATPVPCAALTALGSEPAYPDTDDAIAGAATIGQLAALYAKGRAMRVQRLLEYAVARSSCAF